jgi:uncharacterized protein (DUF1810 family)
MEFDHFATAQDRVYLRVLEELGRGRKASHWMWFVFPQLRGLGSSPMSEAYALDSLAEAARYLEHPLLGPRLRECAELALKAGKERKASAEDIFGYPDYLKFRSSMTLFSLCSPPESVFERALDFFYSGKPDERTVALAGSS